jgi:hypothetical protein
MRTDRCAKVQHSGVNSAQATDENRRWQSVPSERFQILIAWGTLGAAPISLKFVAALAALLRLTILI